MAYKDLTGHCARIDQRRTKYRWDLERDVSWARLPEPGAYFGPALLRALGVDVDALAAEPAAAELLQWSLALASCEEFIALEQVIIRFCARERGLLGPTRSADMLVEEEEKHIELFRRWATHLRAARPAWVADFDRAFADSARLIGHLDERASYPSDATYHYVFWLNTLFFEEYTIYVHEKLAEDAGVVQPAWLEAHALHRREEEQHVLTDLAHVDAIDLDAEERDRWSKMFFVRLAGQFGRFFGLDAARRVVAARHPGVRLLVAGDSADLARVPLYEDLLRSRTFRRTRRAAPYLARLAAGTGVGADAAPHPEPPRAPAAPAAPFGLALPFARPRVWLRLREALLGKRSSRISRHVIRKPPQAVPPAPAAAAPAATTDVVRAAWARGFGLDPAAVGLDDSFASLGGDSPRAVHIHGLLEARYGLLDHRILLECRTVREMATFLDRRGRAAETPAAARAPVTGGDDRAIAIVAAAVRLPGAPDLDAFWRLLAEGRCAIGPVPADRWDASVTTCNAGAFLPDVRGFDPEPFALADEAAREMDPQQRLFLELAAELLAQTPARTRQVGVFAGAGWNDYILRFTADPSLIGPATALGNLDNMVAARAAQLLGLHGPAFTVNAACASSLVAIHMACRSLQTGECELAIAGGVELHLTPTAYRLFARAGVLAANGQCRPFARDAAGFVPGEGGAAVLLKPLARARQDGDDILAVVRGSAVNNDGGATLSGMAPSPAGQLAVMRRAWADAGLSPRTASYVEAHGTGTPVGDPVEVRALHQLLAEAGAARGACGLGSVKSNLGHLFTAAGATSVVKVVLALQHGQLPPTLGGDDPDPRLDFASTPLAPVARLRAWAPPEGAGPRRAGVSAFGVGGTNCHVVLEEAPAEDAAAAPPARDAWPLVVAAPSSEALARVAAGLAEHLAGPVAGASFAAVCAAVNARAPRFPLRRALVVGSAADAAGQLREVRSGRIAVRPPRLVFVLAGPGTQYPGMGRHLWEHEPVFRAELERCATRLRPHLPAPLEQLLFDAREAAAPTPRMDRIDVTQPLVFAFGWALSRWLDSLGVRPDAVVGHSAGEYVAATIAGALDLDDALRLVSERGAGMARSAPGKMAAVLAPEAAVRTLLAGLGGAATEVGFAALNEPSQVVVSGRPEAVDAMLAACAHAGVSTRELRISCAAHSPLMRPVAADFAGHLRGLRAHPPRVPMYSTVHGRALAPGETPGEDYWRAHLEAPVQFAAAVRAARADGHELFLELGGGASLSACVTETLGEGAEVVPLLHREGGWAATAGALGQLVEAGVDVDLGKLGGARRRAHVALPAYPWQRRRLWLGDDAAPGERAAEDGRFTVTEADPAIRDHVARGQAIAPAALLLEWTLAAARRRGGAATSAQDVLIQRPFVPGAAGRAVRVRFAANAATLESRAAGEDAWLEHLSARIDDPAPALAPFALEAARARCRDALPAERLYTHLATSGLGYGASLRAITGLWRGDGEALARLELPEGSARDAYLHPAIVDGAMQAIAALTLGARGAGGSDDDDEGATFLGFAMRAVRIHGPTPARGFAHVALRTPLEAHSDAFRCDVTITGDDGTPVARFEDVALKRVRDGAVRLYAPRWAPAARSPRRPVLPDRVFLASEPSSPLAPLLRRRLEDTGVSVVGSAADAAAVMCLDLPLEALATLAQTVANRTGARPTDWLVVARDRQAPALGRALAAEEGWRVRALLLPPTPASPATEAQLIFERWRGADDDFLRAARADGFEVPTLVPLEDAPAGAAPTTIRRGGVYWITGATGGLGGILASWLARRHGARLLLTGRRADAADGVLDELTRLGGEAIYVSADAADAADMAGAARAARAHWGTIHGVIHAAGLLDDQLVRARSPERRRALLAPKLDGTRALLAALGDAPIDFVACFGSLASWLGGPGQGDYAAANAGMAELARTHPRALVIDWGPWRDVGMVADAAYRARFAGSGLLPLAPADGVRAFVAALAQAPGEPEIVALALDPGREATLAALWNRAPDAAPAPDAAAPEAAPGATDAATSDGSAAAPVLDFLRRELSTARRLPLAQVDPSLPLARLGVDSLIAVGLVRKLERAYGVRLPPTLLFELRTLDEVAAHVESRRGGARAPSPATATAPLAPPPLDDANAITIDVRAAGVNFIDLLAAVGLHPTLGDGAAAVPGHEVAGVVTHVGPAVRHIAPGDRVMALTRSGGYGRRVVTSAASALALPAGFDFEDGAAVLVTGLTAVACLEHHARLQAGERVLVQAAAGATGHACVQLALHLGATVFGTAGGAEKLAHLARLGVHHPIDYRARDFADAVRELTATASDPGGVDVIVDSLSGDAITRGLALLRPGGRFVEIGAAGVVDVPAVDARALFLRNQAFLACNVSQLAHSPALLASLLARLAALLAAGVIRPVIHARYPVAEAARAHDELRARRNLGKLVLTF